MPLLLPFCRVCLSRHKRTWSLQHFTIEERTLEHAEKKAFLKVRDGTRPREELGGGERWGGGRDESERETVKYKTREGRDDGRENSQRR